MKLPLRPFQGGLPKYGSVKQCRIVLHIQEICYGKLTDVSTE